MTPRPLFFRLPAWLPPSRAYHSSEVTYFFDQGFPYTFRPDQRLLSDQLISYWATFAANGDPNRAGQPHWAPFNGRNAQSLAPGAVRGVDLEATHHCQFWSTV
ncbi:carboxylesterase family protein [Fodinicola feengrottensis]|uniref:carboxylesterase family protein n=1 Tax=Fodinicola feengrottensis TaxID=435914 RepID=UPI0013D48480|nr:carboxylesterase family protein [Fodinicola feengrottensis]